VVTQSLTCCWWIKLPECCHLEDRENRLTIERSLMCSQCNVTTKTHIYKDVCFAAREDFWVAVTVINTQSNGDDSRLICHCSVMGRKTILRSICRNRTDNNYSMSLLLPTIQEVIRHLTIVQSQTTKLASMHWHGRRKSELRGWGKYDGVLAHWV